MDVSFDGFESILWIYSHWNFHFLFKLFFRWNDQKYSKRSTSALKLKEDKKLIDNVVNIFDCCVYYLYLGSKRALAVETAWTI